MTQKWCNRTRNAPTGHAKGMNTRILGAFHLLQTCNLQETIVITLKVTSHDQKWLHVLSKWYHWKCHKGLGKAWNTPAFELLQACKSWSLERKWRHLTGSNLMGRGRHWQEKTSQDHKWPHVTGSGIKLAIEGQNLVLDAFQLVQGCNLQEVLITWQEMMSSGKKWP